MLSAFIIRQALSKGKDADKKKKRRAARRKERRSSLRRWDIYPCYKRLESRVRISFTPSHNPGSFRVPLDTARSGGVSDPRNAAMARMFRLIDVGEYTGDGIPNLYRVWKAESWPEPVFTESRNPDRVSLTLYMTSHGSGGETTTGEKQVPLGALSQRQLLIDHLTDHPTSDLFALSKALGVSLSRTESLLQQLIDEGIVTVETDQGNRLYKLKA